MVSHPGGFDVVLRGTTGCRGSGDAGWLWRDLVIQMSMDPETALVSLRTHLESRGFKLTGSAQACGSLAITALCGEPGVKDPDV